MKITEITLHITDESTPLQTVQVEAADGYIYQVTRLQNYGLYSRPPTKSEGVVLDDRLCIAIDAPEHRPQNLNEGDVALYNHKGAQVWLKGKEVHIGKPDATEPQVLGNQLKNLLEQIIDEAIKIAQAPTTMGKVLAEDAAMALNQLKQKLAEILSENHKTS